MLSKAPHHPVHLIGPDVLEGRQALRGEELCVANPAHAAPIGAVGSKREHLVASDHLRGQARRTGQECRVMPFKYLFHHVCAGHDDAWLGACAMN